MYNKLIKNQRGDITIFTVIIFLAVNILIAYLILFISVKLNCINIRNAVKMELNNVSARIYADIYLPQREADLSSYMDELHFSSDYLENLEEDFIDSLTERISIDNNNYKLQNIHLDFSQESGKIEYIYSCDAEFYIKMFGRTYPTVTQNIELTGKHNTKY